MKFLIQHLNRIYIYQRGGIFLSKRYAHDNELHSYFVVCFDQGSTKLLVTKSFLSKKNAPNYDLKSYTNYLVLLEWIHIIYLGVIAILFTTSGRWNLNNYFYNVRMDAKWRRLLARLCVYVVLMKQLHEKRLLGQENVSDELYIRCCNNNLKYE